MTALLEQRLLPLLHQKALEGRGLLASQSYASSALKISGSTQLSYPAVEASIQGRTGVLVSHTFSLTGVLGALPYAYTEILAQRNREKEFAFQAFLDIFNHRAVSLLYEGWVSQMWVDTGLSDTGMLSSKPRAALLAYAGIDQKSASARHLHSFWGHQLNHTGLFSRRTRTASGLVSLLKNQFQLEVKVEQFVGKWFEISQASRYRLTRNTDAFQLGVNTVLGKSTLHLQAFFRVHLQIVNEQQYRSLAPGSSQIKLMQQLIRAYVGEELLFQLVVHVAGTLIPLAPLSGKKATGIRMGWNSLLGKPHTQQHYRTSISRDYSRN